MQCKICGNTENNTTYQAKEMMLGYRDTHEYVQCSVCGCLQLKTIPDNLLDYYPSDYYSYSDVGFPTGLKKFILAQRDYHAVTGKGSLLGKILAKYRPETKLATLQPIGINRDSRILDVGCGAGHLLYALKDAGFQHLLGIDPFNEKRIEYKNGLVIAQQTLEQTEGQWDVIMMHHSFEHISEQQQTLQAAAERLTDNGCCLIRVPTVSSWAWQHYGVNWVQLDAPRHLYLHSVKSMRLLAKQCGLQVKNIVYDSFAFQFWGSEQYEQDIALHDKKSYAVSPDNSSFSLAQIETYTKQANLLNKKKQGDQAAFYLQKA